MPKISVIIPVYNHAEFLEESIESAYNQTLPPHEIIVINDGSTDTSGEIAERYKFAHLPGIQSPVRVVHQTNRGLSSARNAGIMAATGDYILPLDADDVLHENAIERFSHAAITNPNADVIAPSFETFGLRNDKVILGQFTLDDLKKANRMGYFSLIKKSALVECGGYSSKMRWGWEDYSLWFDLYRRGKSFLLLQEVLVKYRVKENSMIIEANKHSDELYGIIRSDFPQLWQ